MTRQSQSASTESQSINQPASAKSLFDEVGSISHSLTDFITPNSPLIFVNPRYYRPTEVDLLIGDASKAKQKLDWQAETKLDKLIEIMVQADFKKVLEKGY